MDNKGKFKFTWQTAIIGGLLILIVGVWAGWIPNPFEPEGGSGINVYLLDKDMEPLAMVNSDHTYIMNISSLGIITYEGQEIGGLGFSLWVEPTKTAGTTTGLVTITWAGERRIFNGVSYGSTYTQGNKDVEWDTKTELLWDKVNDSWIQYTTLSLEILGISEGSYTIRANYDVEAVGIIDGVYKTATADPSVDCTITWTAGTLSLVAGINVTTLQIQ